MKTRFTILGAALALWAAFSIGSPAITSAQAVIQRGWGPSIVLGTSGSQGTISAVACASTTLTGTGADTNETDIFTCTIPANTLSATNKMLRMTVYGSFGANGDNKTLKGYWNGTNLGSIGPTASQNSWRLELTVARSSSTNAKTKIFAVYGTTTTTGGNLAITSDFTTAMIIKVTGQNGTGVAHDIDADFGLVEALN